ncbi:MAG: hypothetical protein HY722_01490 [Planctomycetes bacterium]|nr:hypothetical protein [Planctomycetota bacterium]
MKRHAQPSIALVAVLSPALVMVGGGGGGGERDGDAAAANPLIAELGDAIRGRTYIAADERATFLIRDGSWVLDEDGGRVHRKSRLDKSRCADPEHPALGEADDPAFDCSIDLVFEETAVDADLVAELDFRLRYRADRLHPDRRGMSIFGRSFPGVRLSFEERASDGMIYLRFGYSAAIPAKPGGPPTMDSVLGHIDVQRDPETKRVIAFTGYGNQQCAPPRDDSKPGRIDIAGIPVRAAIEARGFPHNYRYTYVVQ